jgi:hypothetical protein
VTPDDRDLAPEDDAIIGRALRRSALALLVLGALGACFWWLLRDAPAVEAVVPKKIELLPGLEPSPITVPDVRFSDVTAAAGIDFVHANGARGEKLLPEAMGSGAAFFDHDGDGRQDLLLVNARGWSAGAGEAARPTLALYRNRGAGSFEERTREAGLALSLYGTGPAVGDYDGDGDTDLFVAALGPNRLLRNDQGRFTDVTEAAGVAGDPETWSTSAGFVDHDRDGDLDLFVCNYVRWTKAIDLELNFTLNGRDRAYGPPTQYEGSHSYLYRNEGNGTFRDVSSAAGIRVDNPRTGRPAGKALAVTFADVDRDGFPDILVANDTVQNFLFRNRGDGTFEERGAASGLAFDGDGNARGAMGIDAAHYRNDASLGVAIGNFANEMTAFYVSHGARAVFTDEAMGEGIGAASRLYLKFGLFFFDYDLDGRLDMLEANGHLEDEIAQVQASQTYRQSAQLFWNAGPEARAAFQEVPRERLGDLARPVVGRAATYADIDDDGDLDVLLTEVAGRPLLLRNDQRLGHHWLRVKLRGRPPNTEAIGAWVELTAGGVTQRRPVMPTRSYMAQVELPVTFGLGAADRVESLGVTWPDGSVQRVTEVPVDRTIDLRQEG